MRDVAIVGAGPAGARAAFALARRGVRVTLFDGSHPREKPCGGGVTGRALALVADAIDATAFPATNIRSARLVGHGSQTEARVPLEDGALVVASRASFDAALLAAAERAGATLVRTRVTDVSADANAVTLTTDHGAHVTSYVIGADGANSLVRRRLATAFRRDQLSIATGFSQGPLCAMGARMRRRRWMNLKSFRRRSKVWLPSRLAVSCSSSSPINRTWRTVTFRPRF